MSNEEEEGDLGHLDPGLDVVDGIVDIDAQGEGDDEGDEQGQEGRGDRMDGVEGDAQGRANGEREGEMSDGDMIRIMDDVPEATERLGPGRQQRQPRTGDQDPSDGSRSLQSSTQRDRGARTSPSSDLSQNINNARAQHHQQLRTQHLNPLSSSRPQSSLNTRQPSTPTITSNLNSNSISHVLTTHTSTPLSNLSQGPNTNQDQLRELTEGLAYNSNGEKVPLSYAFGSSSENVEGVDDVGADGETTDVKDGLARVGNGSGRDYPVFGRGFVRFVEGWLRERGMGGEGDSPSPLLSAYLSLNPTSINRLTNAAYKVDDLITAVAGSDNVTAVPAEGTSGYAVGDLDADVDGEVEGQGEGQEGKREDDVEILGKAERMGKEVGGMLQHLIRSTNTNYLLLLSPHTNAPSTLPILYHSPLATAFWHSLRGGPTTNLAKFVALSVPTTTTRRLAIPTGARSLDVKSRLNSLMRVQVRDVSGVGDAEMKWTRPEALIGSYGVKIVGWPTGEVQDEGQEEGAEALEEIPQRNPSNNSVAQNKVLLRLVEAGHLRIERATQADKDAYAAQQAETAAKLAANKVAAAENSTEGDADAEGGTSEGGAGGQVDPDGMLLDEAGNPILDDMGGTISTDGIALTSTPGGKPTRGKGRKPRAAADGTPLKSAIKLPRPKSLLTLRPDGTIATGGLEGPRKPGRPRKVADPNSPSIANLPKRKRGRPRGSGNTGNNGVGGQDGIQVDEGGPVGEGDSDLDAIGQPDVSMEQMHGIQHGQHPQQQQHHHHQTHIPHAHLALGHGVGGIGVGIGAPGDELIDHDMSLAQHAGQDDLEEEDPATAGYLEVNNMDSMPDMAEAESSAMALAHMRHSMGDEYTRYYHQDQDQEPNSPGNTQYLEGVVAGEVEGGHHHHHHQGPSLLDMYSGQHGNPDTHFGFPHTDEAQVAVGHNIPLISPFPHNVNVGASASASIQLGPQQGKRLGPSADQAAMVEQAVNAATAAAAAMLGGSTPVSGAGVGGSAGSGGKRSADQAGFRIGDGSAGGAAQGGDKRQRGY